MIRKLVVRATTKHCSDVRVHKGFHIVFSLFLRYCARVVSGLVFCFCPFVPVHQESKDTKSYALGLRLTLFGPNLTQPRYSDKISLLFYTSTRGTRFSRISRFDKLVLVIPHSNVEEERIFSHSSKEQDCIPPKSWSKRDITKPRNTETKHRNNETMKQQNSETAKQ